MIELGSKASFAQESVGRAPGGAQPWVQHLDDRFAIERGLGRSKYRAEATSPELLANHELAEPAPQEIVAGFRLRQGSHGVSCQRWIDVCRLALRRSKRLDADGDRARNA